MDTCVKWMQIAQPAKNAVMVYAIKKITKAIVPVVVAVAAAVAAAAVVIA